MDADAQQRRGDMLEAAITRARETISEIGANVQRLQIAA